MNTRNHLLDLLKIIMSIGVIFVHFPFIGAVGNILASVGTMGVIVFFLISGYGCYRATGENNTANILRRTKHIIRLTIVSVLIYIAFSAVESLLNNNFMEWVVNFTNPLLYPNMILLGNFEFIHADHLWFLVALIYAYLFMYLIEKNH